MEDLVLRAKNSRLAAQIVHYRVRDQLLQDPGGSLWWIDLLTAGRYSPLVELRYVRTVLSASQSANGAAHIMRWRRDHSPW